MSHSDPYHPVYTSSNTNNTRGTARIPYTPGIISIYIYPVYISSNTNNTRGTARIPYTPGIISIYNIYILYTSLVILIILGVQLGYPILQVLYLYIYPVYTSSNTNNTRGTARIPYTPGIISIYIYCVHL